MRSSTLLHHLTVLALVPLATACTDTSTKTVALMCGGKQIEVTFSFSDGATKPVEMRFPLENGTPAVATFSGEPGAPTIVWPMTEEVFLGRVRPRTLTHFQGAQVASLPKTSLIFDDGRACFEAR